ncbi:hypothetical protein GmHk_07G019144 [Glycine max]|nr:hypothetical protein GmHk_07G019144 [Glycine max]
MESITRALEPYRSSSFSFCLRSSLCQSRLRFHECNHIVEIVFVEIVFATYPLRSKKSRKGKSPGKGTPRASFLSQTGLRFRDCNHIAEFAFVEFVSALPSKNKLWSNNRGGLSFTTANWRCCGSALIISLKPQSQVFISLIRKLI